MNMALAGVAVLMFFAYSFLIGHSVVSINQRKSLVRTIQKTQSDVSDLEINYFNLASAIDMKTAAQHGFVESTSPSFSYTNTRADDAVAIR